MFPKVRAAYNFYSKGKHTFMTNGPKGEVTDEHIEHCDWSLLEVSQRCRLQKEVQNLPIPGEAKAKAMPGWLYIHTK